MLLKFVANLGYCKSVFYIFVWFFSITFVLLLFVLFLFTAVDKRSTK